MDWRGRVWGGPVQGNVWCRRAIRPVSGRVTMARSFPGSPPVRGSRGTMRRNWGDDPTRHFSLCVLSLHSNDLLVAWGCESPEDPRSFLPYSPFLLFLCLVSLSSSSATTHWLSTYCVLYAHLISSTQRSHPSPRWSCSPGDVSNLFKFTQLASGRTNKMVRKAWTFKKEVGVKGGYPLEAAPQSRRCLGICPGELAAWGKGPTHRF